MYLPHSLSIGINNLHASEYPVGFVFNEETQSWNERLQRKQLQKHFRPCKKQI